MGDGNKGEAPTANDNDIAIVGMAAHLPGAGSVEDYWKNLCDGIESIRRLSEVDLLAAGETRDRLLHRNYVPAAAPLDGFETFDSDFFGFSPKEAAILDPQHRQFLEVAWEALENAGHPPENFDGPIGAYGGCGMGSYFYFNICSNPDLVDDVGMFLLRHTGNDKDFLTTRLSHVLDLKGPSITVQTACSTSLVATHYACQALLNGECDMALAGGVTIELPQGRGYIFEDGEILSPDGHCHAFDHRAQGTVFGSGAGMVVLRRLADAVADGDHIWAVIKGSAINNDGAAKAGYLAPSVDGQAAAIAEAQAIAGVDAGTVDYVECHGTGTYLGDPIEVAALTNAFRETTAETGFCRIGSVKTNIGHLDTAAGVASLIKTSLSLHNRQIPPSLGFDSPNPSIDFDGSPFRVNTVLSDWTSHKGPRRAGVNSLGVGGTNAHIVLEEAPERVASEQSEWPFHLLTISGRTKTALDGNAKRLAEHLRANPDQPLADVAFTLKEGRRTFEKRRVLVARSHHEAADLLESGDQRRVFDHTPVGETPEVVFMFPGGGAQYAGMARDLYETEPVFHDWMEQGLEVLQPKLDYDIRSIWLPDEDQVAAAAARLQKPSVQLPLIMIVEYALAQLWMSWGVQPAALVGHSMGENTAACLAGVMSFEDCIGLVLLRGQLFDTVPAGGMLSVPLAVDNVKKYLSDDLDIAGINAPELTVVSGPQAALDALAAKLAADEIDCQRIPIDIAAHSQMLEPVLEEFATYLRGINLNAPNIPFLSNRSGSFITTEQATDPDYWVGHLRNTVRYSDCINTLSENANRVYLEVGPGKALSSLTRMQDGVTPNQVVSSLRHPDDLIADDAYFMAVLGRLWATGVSIDWSQIWGEARRNRVVLPTYAFQRSAYFIEPGQAVQHKSAALLARQDDVTKWGYRPVWRPQLADCEYDTSGDLTGVDPHSWLVLLDDTGVGAGVAARLRAAGQSVTGVSAGDAFARRGDEDYVIAPERGREGYDQLLRDLVARGRAPDRIVSFWLTTADESHRPGSSFFHRNQEQGFYSLMFLAQAISDENLPRPLHITAVTTGAMQVRDEDLPYPDKSTVMGPIRVIPREFPGVTCSVLDIELAQRPDRSFLSRLLVQDDDGATDPQTDLVNRVLEDLLAPPRNSVAALRGEKRFESSFRPTELPETTNDSSPRFQKDGVYLITGGFGGIGLTIAEKMIRDAGANVVLLTRKPLPDREGWPRYLRHNSPNDPVVRRIRAVERLEALGGTVMIAAADVCNVEDMRKVAADIRGKFGEITGVVHAAGVIDDGPLLTKSPASVEDVFTPKIHGAQVLDEVFPDGSIEWLALFSSTSTVTAPAGQIDYVAANEYLNAYAKSRAGDATRVVAVNWGIWNEVGMAAEAISGRVGTKGPAPFEPISAPLLDQAGFDAAGNRVFRAEYSTSDRWVLDQHRTKSGEALLPGTGYLELAAEALRANGEDGGFEIRDLLFLRPLDVSDTETRAIRVKLERSDEGYAFDVRSACQMDGQTGFQLHAEAKLALHPMEQAQRLNISDIQARCKDSRTAAEDGSLRSPQEEHLKFGPRWRVLREQFYGSGEGIANLRLPLANRNDVAQGFLLHPALLDLATGWAMELIDDYLPTHLWVPLSYRSAKVYGALPAEVFSWVRIRDDAHGDDTMASFDVTVCDAAGRVLLEVEKFSIKKLETATSLSKSPRLNRSEVEFPDADPEQSRPLSAVEERLQHNLSQGILPKEGAETFERALALDVPQVFVSSLDLTALAEQTAADAEAPEKSGQKFERPELESDYVEPSNDIERTLAGFWQELLGVEQVGVNDNFFDLGGHSLIAVRLFSMVKKAYRTEFPISILFEAPTIAKCAEIIAVRVGVSVNVKAGEPTTEAVEQQKPTRRYTHLVAMHDGEGGPNTPFFLVAGMFGNVLNLRHLAHLLGADRPFYGLQARGLYGEEEPHTSIEQAATDYIAEIRSVQPHGPYLLGGFSGGGITAFEITRQLEAVGEKVAMLAMLDTPLPVRRSLTARDRAVIQWQELRNGGPRYVARWLGNRIRWELSKLKPGGAEPLENDTHSFHNSAIEAAFLEAAHSYPMHVWDGPLTLFRPPLSGKWQVADGRWVDSQRAYILPDNDWGRWVPGVQVVEVPGDHDSMVLEPNVRVLAARMRSRVEAAETRIKADRNGGPLSQAAE